LGASPNRPPEESLVEAGNLLNSQCLTASALLAPNLRSDALSKSGQEAGLGPKWRSLPRTTTVCRAGLHAMPV